MDGNDRVADFILGPSWHSLPAPVRRQKELENTSVVRAAIDDRRLRLDANDAQGSS